MRLRRFICADALLIVLALALGGTVAAQNPEWPSERPPGPLPAHDVAFPQYAIRTLANGLQVIEVPHHEQPAVSLRLVVRAGTAQDPEDKPGVASLAADLLDQGTATKTAAQVATAIDSIGGALGTGAAPDLTYITAVVMKDSLDVGLNLVSDLAQHPAFAPEEIERQRHQSLSALKVSYDDPDYLANTVFDRLVYGRHPYGRPGTGTPASIAAITRDDLVAFHRAWFGANNAILAIVGDVSPEDAFAGAGRAFGSWAKAPEEAPKRIDPPAPANRLVVIDLPGAVQTEIRAGNIAIPRRNRDHMALDLATKVLGGEGANRLHRVLRVEHGLTYGASADLNALKETGDIVAETNTRSATTGETLRLMIDEFWKMTREPVGERELAGAQEYLTGSFPLKIETPSQIATRILDNVFFGLSLDDLQTYRERVSVVTPDDVQRVAREYLHPDKLTVVLVGDASTFVSQLPPVGFDTFERIPIDDLDIASPDLRRIKDHSSMPETDPARALIDKAVAAKGGLKTLQSIRTIRTESTTSYSTLKGPVPFLTTTWIRYPDSYRIEADMPGGKIVQVYTAGRYWIQDATGIHEAPASDPIREGLQRDTIPLLLKLAAGQLVVRELDTQDPALAAVGISGEGMTPLTMFINRENGLIAGVRYESASQPGVRTDELYDDYRDVNGLQVAFHTIVRRTGLPPIEREVKTFKINVPVPSALFVK
jgi:zinc protease